MDGKTYDGLQSKGRTQQLRASTYKAFNLLRRKLTQQQVAELEAKEACDWLRAAGFPQYVQLYEAGHFPIDIPSVRKDHEFLDQDSLKSLCRRLMTLNKCAAMRLEVHFQCKQSEDSEEDDICAISDRWAFQRESKTWSRLRPLSPLSRTVAATSASSDEGGGGGRGAGSQLRPLRASASSESVLSDFSNLDVTSVTSATSALSDSSLSVESAREASPSEAASSFTDGGVVSSSPAAMQSVADVHRDRDADGEEDEEDEQEEKEGKQRTSSMTRDNKPKRCSRSFLRRMESLRRKDQERQARESKEAAEAAALAATSGTASERIPPAHSDGLRCTSDESLPGLKAKKAVKSHTICRSTHVQRNRPAGFRRGCLYLEDYQLGWNRPQGAAATTGVCGGSKSSPLQRKWHTGGGGSAGRLVHLPKDHKPGTFPRSLSIESLCPSSPGLGEGENAAGGWTRGDDGDFSVGSVSSRSGSQDFLNDDSAATFRKRRNSTASVGSVYDNVPEAERSISRSSSSGDLLLAGGAEQALDLDDILRQVHGLQHNIDQWSRQLDGKSQTQGEATFLSGEAAEEVEEDSAVDTTIPSSPQLEERSMSDVGTAMSDYDSTGNSLNDNDGDGEAEMRERRDSGVGASLTRPSRKLRWHSFQNSHRPSVTAASLEINRQSAAQLNLLQKLSLLRLTAIMEKHCETSKHGWNWAVPKFMKRSKVPDYRDKHVFGVPPIVNVQRTGQPLPQSIQQAMRFLRSQCLGQVGLFRKSGVKSRIQALRQLNENNPDHVTYTDQSAYDVADLLKQYFRDLPEPVLTTKLSDTFLQIYQCVPKEQRLQAAQAAVILLPDENREVLQTLLYFLSDIASAPANQMTAETLAVCLAPSILHLNVSKKDVSPRLINRRGGSKPDPKDLTENMAATKGLSHMITECKKLFQIPHEMMLQSRNSYMAADAQPLPLHALGVNLQGEPVDYRAYLEDNIQCLLREAGEKSKGWHSAPCPEHTELTYKKVGDGHPIRLWRASAEMEAPPGVVLQRLLRERHLWDEDLLHSRVLQSLENNTEVFHYITDSMAPHPRRDFVVLRRWCNDLPKGVCVLVSSSVDHDDVQLEAGIRAVLLTSRILIEPCGLGRSRLTHYCRADLRGRSPEWYNKVYGHLCAVEVARIRSSFPVLSARGPETKL
ncbi:stAR-related lipid transfer protein 8 isoform X2 [Engraulis encrasicolus]|uniref:stAR-related lipid transfer protein 8 isoform X2 n=1 Tax=Engraulis encrasicolus TaxID=184585 RepID=UPI002FD0357F